jgi:eukaryotic-like serine/threonine-protein kinase
MSTPSSSPQRIGDYEILAPLGAGGMGRVFKVRNVISNREEAMKVLLPDFAKEPELAARFLAEIRTLATLEHPNIAQLRTAFDYQGHFVMVMEYVEGATLEKLASQGRIPLEQMLDYASQSLAGLSYAHKNGVTHRDIKPANIMITSHGVAKLMDFGIAKSTEDMQLTRPGTTMGSVYYMSPEQVQGGTIDARSDLYSFGVTLYEMFTGKRPFVSESSYTVLNAQINEAPVPLIQVNPDLPVELNNIVLKAMAKDPAARFQNAEEFREALRGLRQPQAAATVGAPARVSAPMSATAAVSAGPMPSAPEPQFAPVPGPVAAPAVAQVRTQSPGKSHRGLWIVMGAIAAVLVIVALATLAPRFYPMLAGKSATQTQPAQTPAQPQPDTSAASSAATPAAPTDLAATSQPTPVPAPAASTPAATSNPPAPRREAGAARQPYVPAPAQSEGQNSTQASAPAVPAGPTPEQVREVHDRLMNLSTRADTARSGVESLQRQQQAQGLDMRTDIVGAMTRMNTLMSEAQRALDRNNLDAANDYMGRAEKDIEKLEKFLSGR